MKRVIVFSLLSTLVLTMFCIEKHPAIAAYKADPKNVLVIGLLAKCKSELLGDGYDYPTATYGNYKNWRPSNPFHVGTSYIYRWAGRSNDAGPLKISVTLGTSSGTVKLLSGDSYGGYSRRDWWACPAKFTITYKYIRDVILYG